jgi:hypothetical protein
VAVLLAVLHDAEAIQEKADLSALLDGLNEVQLRQIIVSVVAENLRFGDRVEHAVNALRRTASAAGDLPPVPPHVDVEAIRRDMRRRFRQAASDSGSGRRGEYGYSYDEFYIDVAAIIEPAVQAAGALLNSGAPTGAVTLLTDVIDEWSECIADLEEWVHESNQDAFDEAARKFDVLLAESLLSLPLTADERKVWCARIDELEDETIALAISRTAIEQGWDYLPVGDCQAAGRARSSHRGIGGCSARVGFGCFAWPGSSGALAGAACACAGCLRPGAACGAGD